MLIQRGATQCNYCGWTERSSICGRCGSAKGVLVDGYQMYVTPGYMMNGNLVGPNQTQDGDAMFAVLNYNFQTGTAVMTNKVTQAEAQESGEQMIAAYRANIQVKQFFSVSILNLKTGVLIGSVVDAPPAIDWGGSK